MTERNTIYPLLPPATRAPRKSLLRWMQELPAGVSAHDAAIERIIEDKQRKRALRILKGGKR